MRHQFFNDKLNRRIVNALLSATLVILIVCGVIGGRQNGLFLEDGLKLAQAQGFMAQENLREAYANYTELVQKYPHSYLLLWEYGTHLALKRDYENAVTYYRRALEENPNIARKATFLIEISEGLYQIGEYEEAAQYLQVLSLMELDEIGHEVVESKLHQITEALGGNASGK